MTRATWLWELAGAWRLDGLSWLFLVLVAVVGGCALLYSPPYLRQGRYAGESQARYWPVFALFVLGMAGVLAAWDLVLFLVCWEVMTLASYLLVAYETSEPAALRAAFKYFVMTHVGTACLLLAVLLLGVRGGSFGFDDLPGTLRDLAVAHPVLLHLVLGLMFVGFATKGGLYPFGDWLPDAHPAAPAPVSAVLSGVMVKLGLYGFLRFFVWTLAAVDPSAAVPWGYGLAAFGVLSALVGGLAACAATDGKVLLAYSSIAQSGLIATGTGAALILLPVSPPLAALALLAALFHITGDAVVKALLFLNAGALQFRTGSRRLADLGGMLRGMPVTGATALAGTLAIAGFPPLTAFTSKWLLLQSTVLSGSPVVAVAGFGVLVASVLSILYAVKLFSAAFLDRPMREGDLEVPGPMRWAELGLAGCIVVLSAAPGLWLRTLAGIVEAAPSVPPGAAAAGAWGALVLGPPTGAFAPLLLVLLGLWAAALVRSALGHGVEARQGVIWTGGLPGSRVTAHPDGFYSLVRRELARGYVPLRLPRVALPAWLPAVLDPDRWFYRPLGVAGRRATGVLRGLHSGVPHTYIAWQLLGALALVLLLLLRRRLLTP